VAEANTKISARARAGNDAVATSCLDTLTEMLAANTAPRVKLHLA
jgi:hypothetical protein